MDGASFHARFNTSKLLGSYKDEGANAIYCFDNLAKGNGNREDQPNDSLYSSSSPNSLPVFRLIRCNLLQARQVTASYSLS